MGRSPCCSKEGLNRGAWTALEDQILTAYIKAHGEGSWRNLPKRAGLKRCGKSCRLRWLNYLRPDIKRGNISRDEDELIIRLHKLLGNRWSLIAGRLPGRTDNEIKNYWNTTLGKKAKDRSSSSQPEESPPSDSRLKSRATEPMTTQATQVIRTKATRCTKVVISSPSSSPAEDGNITSSTAMDQALAFLRNYSQECDRSSQFLYGADEDFHAQQYGSDFLNFCCKEFQGNTGEAQVDLHYNEKFSTGNEQLTSSFAHEAMIKDCNMDSASENDTVDLESLAVLLDISEEWP